MIYTKRGDQGETSLVGGTRVGKDDVRVEAYGTVDELNAQVALLAEMGKENPFYATLKQIQRHLFIIQTLLATEEKSLRSMFPQIQSSDIELLEHEIDALTEQLPAIKTFVLPGGSMMGAQCHVARCVCRRAERRVVTLATTAEVAPTILQYLNRLSDYLFVLSRSITIAQGEEQLVGVGR